MSRRFQKRRRAILAQREMMAVMAEEEMHKKQRDALARVHRELDLLETGHVDFLSVPQPDFQNKTGAQILEHVADHITHKLEGGTEG